MTVDRIFKTLIAYAGFFLAFKILLYTVEPGWQITTLAFAFSAATLGTLWWGVSQRPNGPSYPSTVRAKLQQGFRNGAKKD